jgi:hypothetical protein
VIVDGEYCGPVGSMGAHQWHVTTRDARTFRLYGELVFTPKGTALVFCDCGKPHLLLGLANGRWGSIVAEDVK